MRRYPISYLMHGGVFLALEALHLGRRDCDCAPILAAKAQPVPDPGRGDELSIVSVMPSERTAITTSAPGIQPGTGELMLAGYEPDVLVRAVETLSSSVTRPTSPGTTG
jgi:hypothetical protein